MTAKIYIGVRLPPIAVNGESLVLVVNEETKKSSYLRHRCNENTAYGRKLKRVYGCHSPDGFNWGYGGSGPAELAFMLLLDFGLKPEHAWEAHQALNTAIICRMPQDGSWILTSDALAAWHLTYHDQTAWGEIAEVVAEGMTSISLDSEPFQALARVLRYREARASVALDHDPDAGTHVIPS